MTNVTVVCGPPGSGKTTYVRDRAHWGDLIIDLDAIFAAIGGTARHEHPPELLPFALVAKDALLSRLERDNGVHRAWIIMGAAKRVERQELRYTFGATVVVLETPVEECLWRIREDINRDSRRGDWRPMVERWWKDYHRDDADEHRAPMREELPRHGRRPHHGSCPTAGDGVKGVASCRNWTS